jgi:hypothetical protein
MRFCLAVLLAAWPLLSPALAAAAPPEWQACVRAGVEAERRFGIPPGLLQAIGVVESGRGGGPEAGAAPWPWTIDAEAHSRFFASRAEAVSATRALLARGVASVDVGCFQVNLYYHPNAFASLEEAFDPLANALYAARFLRQLYARGGSWRAAVAAYHSATPGRGEPYRERVFASWKGSAEPVPAAAPAPVIAFGVRINTPLPVGSAPEVIALRPVAGLPALFAGRS